MIMNKIKLKKQIKLIKADVNNIKKIDNPSDDVYLEVIK